MKAAHSLALLDIDGRESAALSILSRRRACSGFRRGVSNENRGPKAVPQRRIGLIMDTVQVGTKFGIGGEGDLYYFRPEHSVALSQ